MDKLQPLITHKFWIFFAIALLLPTIGWWMGTGQLIAQIDEQEAKITKTFNEVPKTSAPNSTFAKELKKINDKERMRLAEAAELLQGTQHGLRVWPKEIAHRMRDIPYLGEIKDLVARGAYRDVYFKAVERLREIVDPFDPETNQGKVILDDGAIPAVSPDRWQFFSPTSQEMWEEQEDLWLLKELLVSIAAVNEGSTTITESPVREIVEILLAGGDRSALDQEGGTGGKGKGEGPGAAGMSAGMMMPGYSDSGAGNRGLGRGGPGRNSAGIDFPLEDVFGPATLRATEGQATSTEDPADAEPHEMSGGPGGAQAKKLKRYVDDEEGVPFKTRGFKLTVVMDHRKLPDLLVHLTNSKWPVQIERVHQASLNRDDGGGTRNQRQNPMAGRFGSRQDFRSAGGPEESMDAAAFEGPDAEFRGAAGGAAGGRGRMLGNSVAAAMADPFLARVVLAGLMTMYDPPKAQKQATGQPSEKAAPAQDANQPAPEPAADAAPAKPLPAQDGTKPAATMTDGQPAENEPNQPTSEPEKKPDTATEPDTKAKLDTATEPNPGTETKPE